MRLRNWLPVALVLWPFGASIPADSGSPALRHVLALAGEIGARPTGTDADRRAAAYVQAALEAAGLAVERREVGTVRDPEGERAAGTWNVVGRLAGERPETLLVAAHHDTAGATVPGANDDASGVAVLIETARRTAARPRRLSYLFVSFGGEEEGLLGSRVLAADPALPPLRAVIALELVGRGGLLVGPVPGPPPIWAQRLLLRSAAAAGAGGVLAPVPWSLVPRFLDLPHGADHVPFLERGTPAFLLLGTYPGWTYHTREDSVSRVRVEALERTVAVLDRLLLDLERAPPDTATDPHYLPLILLGRGLLLPSVTLWGIALLAPAVAAFAALRGAGLVARARRIGVVLRVLLVTGAVTALAVAGCFVGALILERVHGVRFPWWAHQRLHLGVAAAGGLLTGWMAIKLFRRIKPTVEPGPYLAAALLPPLLACGWGTRAGWPELAFYPAWIVLILLASRLTASIGWKLALGLLAASPLPLSFAPADYRALVDLGGVVPGGWILYAAAFGVVLPFALYLAHVGAHQDCLHSRAWRMIAGGRVGAGLALAWVGLTLAGAWLPAYDGAHRRVIRVRQTLDLDRRRASASLESAELLYGVRLRGAGGMAAEGRGTHVDRPFPDAGIEMEARALRPEDAPPGTVTVDLRFRAPWPAERLRATFLSTSGFRVPGRDGGRRSSYTFTTLAPVPDRVERHTLIVPPGGDLRVRLRADFDADLLELRPEGTAAVFVHQGVVAASRMLLRGTGPAATSPSGR
jgi:hypothetical protein